LLIGSDPVDAAFLDPPYNVKVDGHVGGKGKVRHREFAMASGEMSEDQFVRYLQETLGACAEISRPGAVHFVCMDHHHIGELTTAGRAVYGARLNVCVWRKSNAGMGSLYRSQHELVFVYRVGDAPHFNAVQLGKHGRNRTNVWRYDSVNTFRGSRRHDLAMHPTVKPTKLVSDAIMDVTRRGERVLDAFLGSGTTLIACERTGRHCRGAEIDPIYTDLALQRWSALTGSEAMLEATGETWSHIRNMRKAEVAQ
jgi:DNA modification methylase